MNKKRTKPMKKTIASIIATSMLTISSINITHANASNIDDLQIRVTPSPNIDVVLTVGDTNMNLTNFSSDLKKELLERGIETSKVNIQAIKTKTISSNSVDASKIFNEWRKYPLISDSKFDAGWKLSGDEIYTTANVHWTGFWDDSQEAQNSTYQDIEFDVMTTQHQDPWGFTFRMTSPSTDVYSFYALEWSPYHHELALARIDRWKPSSSDPTHAGPLYHGTIGAADGTYENYGGGDRKAESLSDVRGTVLAAQSFDVAFYRWDHARIVANGNHIQVWVNNQKIFDVYDSNPLLKGSYGPYTASQYNTHFKNVKISTQTSKKFDEVIREPKWRENSERFIVNVADNNISDFNNSVERGSILSRLINENINYVAFGTSSNKSQAEDFIKSNNNNGIFINNQNYSTAIDQLADYIVDKVEAESESSSSEYVLLNEPVNIDVIPSSLKTNTANEEYPQGRWRIDHDYDYYENNMGQADWSGQYQDDLVLTFDKPGRYELWFEDKHPNPQYIYVHRKPIANFNINVSKEGNSYKATIENLSYDLDNESKENKGIVEEEWKWKKSTDSNWINGQIPSTLEAGKTYIVQLRVKDEQGAWSDPVAKYISTESSVVTEPVASFSLPSNATLYEQVDVKDTSYDPAGNNIVQKQWIVQKDGKQVYSGSAPLTNFQSYGEGTYKVTLKVKNSAGLWSEEFSRFITITKDNMNPTLIADPVRVDWTNKDVDVNVQFDDDGGSGFKDFRYAITNSPTAPESGWSNYNTNKSLHLTFSDEGEHYVHFEVRDNAGNKLERTIGPFQIDKTSPEKATFTASKTTPTNENISVDIHYPKDAVIKEYKLSEEDSWKEYSEPILFTENGKVFARSIDRAGNISSTTSYEVNNIDKEKPEVPQIYADELEKLVQEIHVAIDYPEDEYAKKQYRVDGGEWKDYTEPITLNEDGLVEARSIDIAGNISDVASLKINNVDSVPPEEPSVKINQDSREISLDAGFDEKGVEKIFYRINGKEWNEYTSPIELKDGEYMIEMYNVDKVGLKSSVKTQRITVMNSVLKDLNTALESRDLNSVLKLEERLKQYDENNSDLDEVRQKVQELKNQLETEKLLEQAKKEVSNAEKFRTKLNLTRAQQVVNQLPDGEEKENLQSRLNALKTEQNSKLQQEAEALMEQVRLNPSVKNKEKVQEAINKLPDGEAKTELQEVLNEMELTILSKEVSKLVEQAERVSVSANIEKAQEAIQKLPDGGVKTELQNRINALKESKELAKENEAKKIMKQLKLYPTTKNKELAQQAINQLSNGDLKERLQKQLDNIEVTRQIDEAVQLVEKAEKYLVKAYIKDAQNAINQLDKGETKDALQQRLDKVKDHRLEAKEQTKVEKAVKYVELTEKSPDKVYLKTAKNQVDALSDGEIKEELQARLSVVEDVINQMKVSKEQSLAEFIARDYIKQLRIKYFENIESLTIGWIEQVHDDSVKNELMEQLLELRDANN